MDINKEYKIIRDKLLSSGKNEDWLFAKLLDQIGENIALQQKICLLQIDLEREKYNREIGEN